MKSILQIIMVGTFYYFNACSLLLRLYTKYYLGATQKVEITQKCILAETEIVSFFGGKGTCVYNRGGQIIQSYVVS